MSEIVTEVARAIWRQRVKFAAEAGIDLSRDSEDHMVTQNGVMDEARAAIEAMRNPSKEMIEAGYTSIHDCIDYYNYDSGSGYSVEPFAPTQTWQAMIDTALGTKP